MHKQWKQLTMRDKKPNTNIKEEPEETNDIENDVEEILKKYTNISDL